MWVKRLKRLRVCWDQLKIPCFDTKSGALGLGADSHKDFTWVYIWRSASHLSCLITKSSSADVYNKLTTCRAVCGVGVWLLRTAEFTEISWDSRRQHQRAVSGVMQRPNKLINDSKKLIYVSRKLWGSFMDTRTLSALSEVVSSSPPWRDIWCIYSYGFNGLFNFITYIYIFFSQLLQLSSQKFSLLRDFLMTHSWIAGSCATPV